MVVIPDLVALRALRNYYFESPTGCHVSRYSMGSHGYAQVGWGSKKSGRGMTTAQRAAWTAVYGQIPDGMTIDHMCKNRRCVNVHHLRMLDNFENARRTSGRDWPLGQCINGHADKWRIRVNGGAKWACGVCHREWRRRADERRRTG